MYKAVKMLIHSSLPFGLKGLFILTGKVLYSQEIKITSSFAFKMMDAALFAGLEWTNAV